MLLNSGSVSAASAPSGMSEATRPDRRVRGRAVRALSCKQGIKCAGSTTVTTMTRPAAVGQQHRPEILTIFLAISDERAVLAREDVTVKFDQEVLVELERAGELVGELPDRLEELRKDGRFFFGVD